MPIQLFSWPTTWGRLPAGRSCFFGNEQRDVRPWTYRRPPIVYKLLELLEKCEIRLGQIHSQFQNGLHQQTISHLNEFPPDLWRCIGWLATVLLE